MKKRRTNPDFHNGVPELLILQLLARRPMHGYALVRAINRETGGALAFGEGCIYPILHRLEAQGQLDCDQNRRRRANPTRLSSDRGRQETVGGIDLRVGLRRPGRRSSAARRRPCADQDCLNRCAAPLPRGTSPQNYVNRLIEELEDHAIRLLEENNSMDATLVDRCLGPSETSAEHAVREYRGRTFGGRHPIWTFVIAPILLTALLGAAWLLAEYLVCCGVELIAQLATDESFFEPPAGTLDVSRRVLYHSLCAAFCYLPASAACLLLGRSAARAGRGWPWALAACSLAALIAGCFFWKILPITAERPSELCIFGFGWSGLRGMVLRCPQYLIPLSLGGWAFLRAGGAFADGRLAAAPK